MRKAIIGTGGMVLLQALKDAGVEYLFTNPGSAEPGIFGAMADDGDQRLVVGKHEGLVAAPNGRVTSRTSSCRNEAQARLPAPCAKQQTSSWSSTKRSWNTRRRTASRTP